MPIIKSQPIPESKEDNNYTNVRDALKRFGFDVIKRAMQSSNFVSGSAGWKLTAEGNLEANTVTLYSNVADAITIDYGSDILLKHGGDIKFTSVTAPTACTGALAGAGAGNVDNGDHYYKITYVNASGETELGAVSNLVTVADKTADGQVSLTGIPVSTSGSVTSRKIYRTKANEADYLFLATIADNTTTTYTDNTADVDLTGGAANSRDNTSFGKIIIDGIVSMNVQAESTFLGREAGNATTTGHDNVFVGKRAGYSNTTGYYNTFLGRHSGYSNTTGYSNVVIGFAALYTNINGCRNTAIGYNSLNKNTEGRYNTANGAYVLDANTTGDFNTAIGYSSLSVNQTGIQNIALGAYAGYWETGSDAFYVNNQYRINTAEDKAKSLMYGVMNADQMLQKLQINANLKIGAGDVRATTAGTRVFDIFDGTAPAGTLANGISLYSTAGELRVMDAAGNATLLSPHDKKTNEWVYDCVDKNGKRLRINMEQMMKAINKKYGWDFIKEFED